MSRPAKDWVVGVWVWGLVLTACKSEPPSSAPPQKPAATAAQAPSFRRDIAPVLQATCASARGCHGADPVDWIDMDLRVEASYAQLVNQTSLTRDRSVRVKPGSPAESMLIDKLKGTLKPREGERMPLDPRTHHSADPNPLPKDFVDKTLEPWIAAGAPNN